MNREETNDKRKDLLDKAEKAINNSQLEHAELYMQLAGFFNTRPL